MFLWSPHCQSTEIGQALAQSIELAEAARYHDTRKWHTAVTDGIKIRLQQKQDAFGDRDRLLGRAARTDET